MPRQGALPFNVEGFWQLLDDESREDEGIDREGRLLNEMMGG